MLRNNFDRRVAGLNITRSQWAMIAVVVHQPGASQRDIAEMLEMSEASAGRLIDRLCNEGLLERRAREDDRRAREVFITEKAQPLMAKLAEIATASEAHLFEGFSDADLDDLAGYLERLYENATKR